LFPSCFLSVMPLIAIIFELVSELSSFIHYYRCRCGVYTSGLHSSSCEIMSRL
jgi:hypothetical protein